MISNARNAWIWSWGEPYQIESVPQSDVVRARPPRAACRARARPGRVAHQVPPGRAELGVDVAAGPDAGVAQRRTRRSTPPSAGLGVRALGVRRLRSPSGTRRSAGRGAPPPRARCRRATRTRLAPPESPLCTQTMRVAVSATRRGTPRRPGARRRCGRRATSPVRACACTPSTPRSVPRVQLASCRRARRRCEPTCGTARRRAAARARRRTAASRAGGRCSIVVDRQRVGVAGDRDAPRARPSTVSLRRNSSSR